MFSGVATELLRDGQGIAENFLPFDEGILAFQIVEALRIFARVTLDHKRITLIVRPDSNADKRAEVLHEWHKSLLHEAVRPLIANWEKKLGVKVAGYFLQRMKTKWGGCNHRAGHIRLNTELVKKPKDLLEYVIVHEMAHLLEPTHNDRFIAILQKHYPTWREARAGLNELPLTAEVWKD